MPYQLGKDNRTGYETSNINAVMDGELDGFINAYLKAVYPPVVPSSISMTSALFRLK